MKETCDYVMKALLYLSGWHLSLYFRPNELQEMQCSMLEKIIDTINDFVLYVVEEQLQAHEGELKPEKEKECLSEEGKRKFIEKYK